MSAILLSSCVNDNTKIVHNPQFDSWALWLHEFMPSFKVIPCPISGTQIIGFGKVLYDNACGHIPTLYNFFGLLS